MHAATTWSMACLAALAGTLFFTAAMPFPTVGASLLDLPPLCAAKARAGRVLSVIAVPRSRRLAGRMIRRQPLGGGRVHLAWRRCAAAALRRRRGASLRCFYLNSLPHPYRN